MKILIVGGVAGGASCAARARRLSEDAEIIMFERGPYVSFANCGLPYYVGNVIQDESRLLVATPRLFKERFNIEVRVENEVRGIDRTKKLLKVVDLETGREYDESYDALVLAPGAAPIRPPLDGIDTPGIFSLRTIPDSRLIREWIQATQARRTVIVGGGFIGLEMAENLCGLGLEVSVMEMLPQVMPPMDPEMMAPVHTHLREKGVSLFLGDAVAGFSRSECGVLSVHSKSGKAHETDLVILAIGVRPESGLAREAGLELGERGGIKVNESMQTSDAAIWAAGDAVETRDFVTGQPAMIPLAGPANRQGRIAADTILGRESVFRGVQATAVCRIFEMTVASTGASEKLLKRLGINYEKIYLHPANHVGYYPGAQSMDLKLVFSPEDGRVLGAQVVGGEGVEKRVDILATAIQKQATVYDLEEAELCYAPQYGAAKDPINLAGMIASNHLRGDGPVVHWPEKIPEDVLLVDVRTPQEFEKSHFKGAVCLPLDELRERMPELPKDRDLWVYCQVGQRGYYATRALRLSGYRAFNLSGGMQTGEALKG